MPSTTTRTEFHCHTRFSPDGHDTMAAMCEQALKNGLHTIAFTEHAEWHERWNTVPPLHAYFADIAQCREQYGPLGLRVLSGIELGNPHEHRKHVAKLMTNHSFDVVIASLHWLYGESIQMESCFQDRASDDVYADYFTALGEMASLSNAHIIGHFDRIMWRGALRGTPLRPERLEPTIRESLATIAWRDMALELNTRFLRTEPGWQDELALMLHWFVEEGGRKVVINSDAHGTWQLGANVDVAVELLHRAGIEPLSEFGALAAPAGQVANPSESMRTP